MGTQAINEIQVAESVLRKARAIRRRAEYIIENSDKAIADLERQGISDTGVSQTQYPSVVLSYAAEKIALTGLDAVAILDGSDLVVKAYNTGELD